MIVIYKAATTKPVSCARTAPEPGRAGCDAVEVPVSEQERAEAIRRALGARLRELRTARGLSQDRLAALSGVSRVYVGRIERGQQTLSLVLIGKIAEALAVAPAALLDGSGGEAGGTPGSTVPEARGRAERGGARSGLDDLTIRIRAMLEEAYARGMRDAHARADGTHRDEESHRTAPDAGGDSPGST